MPSILIADDSAAVRRGLRRVLRGRTTFEIIEAVDGLDAIAKTKAQQPDLIILDLAMPRMNGFDAARVLRAEMVRVPIILFTMFASTVPSSLLVEAGINVVVSKGDTSALLSQIQSMLPARSKKRA